MMLWLASSEWCYIVSGQNDALMSAKTDVMVYQLKMMLSCQNDALMSAKTDVMVYQLKMMLGCVSLE